jgi:hypothetical protein
MRIFSTLSTLLLALLCGAGCADRSPREAPSQYFRVVSLPEVPLNSKQLERLESVEVVMQGGRFMSINRLPDDWSGEVLPGSSPATLRLQAGRHGSALRRASDLGGFATVLVYAPATFQIAASLTVCGPDGELSKRTIPLKQPELILAPLPNPLAQSPGGRAPR